MPLGQACRVKNFAGFQNDFLFRLTRSEQPTAWRRAVQKTLWMFMFFESNQKTLNVTFQHQKKSRLKNDFIYDAGQRFSGTIPLSGEY